MCDPLDFTSPNVGEIRMLWQERGAGSKHAEPARAPALLPAGVLLSELINV